MKRKYASFDGRAAELRVARIQTMDSMHVELIGMMGWPSTTLVFWVRLANKKWNEIIGSQGRRSLKKFSPNYTEHRKT